MLRTVLIAVVLVFTALSVRSGTQTIGAGPFVAGEIQVKFRPGVAASAQSDAHRAAGGTRRAEIARTGLQLVSVPPGDEYAAVARYERNPNVLYAEVNHIRRIPAPSAHASATEVVPGDYYFKEQYGFHNTGQLFYCLVWIGDSLLCFYVGTPDADIDAPEAWAHSMGSSLVTVAVIDSGIDYTHPDLASNYVGGYDFVAPDGDPMDDHGHGTHVAGTIAAAMNNQTGSPAAEEGVVGVAPNARILAYKACRADGSCSEFAIAQAIAEAVTQGAKVINLSLGSTAYSQAMDDAVQDAWHAGLVIVAGAGNNGTMAPFYPAALPNVLSVAAFDEDHRRASFSNYGWPDLSAPGNVIISSYPMSACAGAGNVPGDTGCYTWLSGTSMATPHVSGAAALVWSRSDVTSNTQVVDILRNSANPQGVDSVRLDTWTKHGGLNLHNALSYGVTNLAPQAHAGPDQTVTDTDGDGGEMVTLDGSASVDPDGNIVSYEWREAGTAIALGQAPSVWLTVGVHTLTLQVTDDDGASAVDTVVVTVNAAAEPPPPTPVLSVTGLTPNVVGQNVGTQAFVITGTGFAAGATVSFVNGSGPAPRVLSVTQDSSTQLTANVEIRAGGRRNRSFDVKVTNPDGSSAMGADLLTLTP